MRKTITFLGGDYRQVRMAEMFVSDGWEVATWGLEKGGGVCPVPLDRAMEGEIIVMPLPVCKGDRLNLPLTDTVVTPIEIWKKIRPDKLVFGGAWGTLGETLRTTYGLEVMDYYEREDVQIANAVPTAEGAIMRMMEETEYTVQGSRCLVVGYGRIGKALAGRLQTLGAAVTVAARRHSDLAWIRACGFRPIRIIDMLTHLDGFDVIFNTVPAQVLDAEHIRRIPKDTLLVELASLPGGFDAEAVKEKDLRMIAEPGLPGKVAPLSAALAIKEGIVEILRERGEEV